MLFFESGCCLGVREGLAWRGKGRGGSKGFGSGGGVGGRGTGPRDGANFATCVVFLSFLTRTKRRKMTFFEGCPVGWGGGTDRSWPGGQGGRGVGAGWQFQRTQFQRGASLGKGWLAWQFHRRGQGLGVPEG